MRIAITGGSGGIGRAVVALALEQGHSAVNIDRAPPPADAPQPGVPFVQIDLADYDALLGAMAGCDALIHLAALPSPEGLPAHVVHTNNVVGSYNALAGAVEAGIRRICQASSVNAIGHSYSRRARYDYFPIDEQHPTYNEDPYSLSKWICEQQADSLCRRHADLRVASLRFHWVVPAVALPRRSYAEVGVQEGAKHLWAWTSLEAAARACLLGVTAAFDGHQPLFIVAPATVVDTPSRELARQFYPEVQIRGDLPGNAGFFSCARAERVLGWRHDSEE
jgi:nucleoside-diphosphate-sugar epimerase